MKVLNPVGVQTKGNAYRHTAGTPQYLDFTVPRVKSHARVIRDIKKKYTKNLLCWSGARVTIEKNRPKKYTYVILFECQREGLFFFLMSAQGYPEIKTSFSPTITTLCPNGGQTENNPDWQSLQHIPEDPLRGTRLCLCAAGVIQRMPERVVRLISLCKVYRGQEYAENRSAARASTRQACRPSRRCLLSPASSPSLWGGGPLVFPVRHMGPWSPLPPHHGPARRNGARSRDFRVDGVPTQLVLRKKRLARAEFLCPPSQAECWNCQWFGVLRASGSEWMCE